MDRRARRPAEPEEADGQEEGAQHRGLQTDLGAEFSVLVEFGLDEFIAVVEEWWDDDEGAEEDAEEGEAFETLGEMVDLAEDDGERFEPEVEQAVDEGDVEIKCEANGFFYREGKWPDEDHKKNFLRGHAFGFELGLAFDLVVASSFADVDSPTVEDVT